MAEFTSQGQGTLNTVLGALGTAAFAGIGNGEGIGLFGSKNGATKDDVATSRELAEKDATIALLRSNAETDGKLVEVYNSLAQRDKDIRADMASEFKDVRAEIRAEHDAQTAINQTQSIYNCSNNSAVALLQAQVAQLSGMTKMVIPITNVCPEPAVKTS